MHPKVVFSDIDGTLIDIFTQRYGNSQEMVKKLSNSSIPIVLCSSKTWSEQEKVRKDLGLEQEPFIVENGGAIVIPNGYFDDVECGRSVSDYSVIELGKPYAEIHKTLQDIRKKTRIAFKGVGDISIEELTKIVGMTYEEAARMSNRQYGETILELDNAKKNQFEQLVREAGLQVIHGGRYFDVTAGNDKGKAVRILMDFYRKKLGSDTIFVGVGDSQNDVPMLQSTDVSILVQNHDGSWSDLGISGIIYVEGIGPAGWKNVFAKIMQAESYS